MDRKILFAIGGVILLIIIAIIAFLLFGKPQKTEEQSTTAQESGEESFTGSILNLLGTGRNAQCTFSRSDEAGTTRGHVYLAGEKMYGEFTTDANDQSFDAYIIRDAENAYSWSTLSNQGTKMKLDEIEATESGQTEDETEKTLDENLDLKCKPWIVDDSKFVPPSDIEFVDLSAQVEGVKKTTQKQIENLQSVCNQLTGDAKAQCIQAISQ